MSSIYGGLQAKSLILTNWQYCQNAAHSLHMVGKNSIKDDDANELVDLSTGLIKKLQKQNRTVEQEIAKQRLDALNKINLIEEYQQAKINLNFYMT